MDATIHAREWLSIATILKIMQHVKVTLIYTRTFLYIDDDESCSNNTGN